MEIFSRFPILAIVKHKTIEAGPFLPHGHSLNELGKVHELLLHTNYQDSRPCGFRQEDFFHIFPI